MAIENKLVKFGYGFNAAESVKEGMLSFDASAQAIYVGDGTTANLVTSSVKDVTYVDNVLTITKIDGTQHSLNFSDVASAKQTMAVFEALETSIKGNGTAIGELSDKLDASFGALDASYKAADASLKEAYEAADASLSERIAAFESGNNSVATQIANKIAELDSSKEAEDASKFVKVKVDIVDGKLSENGVVVTTTDIAKASDLSTHINDTSKHITDAEREKWNQAAADVSAFLNDASLGDEVINTLTEIQNYITSDASLANQITQNISDVSTAAAAAQADVDAVEAALGNGFSSDSTVAAQLAAVKNTADAAAVKASVDTSLGLKADKSALEATDASLKTVTDSYVISFGGAKGVISVDTTNSTQGEVKFTMADSTLKGTVNGLGSAAFEASTAFDAAGSASAAQTAAINAVTGTADDTSAAKTIEGTRKYAAELVAAVPAATVTGVNSADVSSNGGYVTIALELNNKEVAVKSVAVDTQAVATADASTDGLATAYDVKQYVDAKDASMDERMDAVEAQLKWVIL